MAQTEATVVASCPEKYHDHVVKICQHLNIQKAFGKAGDMVNDLSGKDWVPKWEAKVVMAVVTKAQTLGVQKAKIICIAGGPMCDKEMARQPQLVKAVKKEMGSDSFRVSVEWMEAEDFFERYAAGGGPPRGKGRGKAADGAKPGEAAAPGPKVGAANTKPPKAAASEPKAAGHPKAASTAAPKEKRALCKFFSSSGGCRNGDACAFAHVAAPQSEPAQRAAAPAAGAAPDSAPKAKGKAKGATDFACSGCGRKFASEMALEQHEEATGHGLEFECTVCGKVFADEQALEQHGTDTGHGAGFACSACGKTFESEQALQQHGHATGHLAPGTAVLLRCACRRTFSTLQSLQQHLEQQARDGPDGGCMRILHQRGALDPVDGLFSEANRAFRRSLGDRSLDHWS